MVIPGVDICAYCKTSVQGLDRLNNNALLRLFQLHNPQYGRATRFCAHCRNRAQTKLARRRQNQAIAERKAARSAGQTTGSYSNTSNPVLSQSSNGSGDQPSTSKRSREEAGPSRNVAKRTGGRPVPQVPAVPAIPAIPLFEESAEQPSSSSNSQQSHSNRTNRSNVSSRHGSQSNVSSRHGSQSSVPDVGPMDDDDDLPGGQNVSRQSSSGSTQAPMPRHRTQRTQSPRNLSPNRMRNMSAQERSQEMNSFNRGHGG